MKGIGMKWETWIGAGVAYCAECGAPFLKRKEIIVMGNVKEAVDEALLLTKIAKKVSLVTAAETLSHPRAGRCLKGRTPGKNRRQQ